MSFVTKLALAFPTALLLVPLAVLHAQEASFLTPRERPDLRFSFDAPAGPQFTDAEKEAQRGRGK